jgi:hypothetical protein
MPPAEHTSQPQGRQLRMDPGEGWLYEIGGVYFLVYTTGSGDCWDACRTDAEGRSFHHVIATGPSRADVVRQLTSRRS